MENVQNPQDTLNAALIFAKALSLILEENQGIVVDIQNDLELVEKTDKVIVFKNGQEIHIYKCDDDLAEGTAVRMNNSEEDSK